MTPCACTTTPLHPGEHAVYLDGVTHVADPGECEVAS